MASALNGKFTWYELHTSDLDAAERFYGKVLGWTPRDAGMPDFRYSLMSAAAGCDIAGMMTPMTPNSPRAWYGYIAVEDIEAVAVKVEKGGATLLIPIHPIPGVGRFTMVSDPQGAVFALIEYSPDYQLPSVSPEGLPGHGRWRELHTSDQNAAYDFYKEQFGWLKGRALDMGPVGVYQLLEPAGGGEANSAIFNDHDRPPFWMFYFWVDDIDAGQEAVLANGGKVVNGPMEVPGGTWVFEARDPQGITFSLEGHRTKK